MEEAAREHLSWGWKEPAASWVGGKEMGNDRNIWLMRRIYPAVLQVPAPRSLPVTLAASEQRGLWSFLLTPRALDHSCHLD